MTKASDLLVAALENEGVGYIFAIPGALQANSNRSGEPAPPYTIAA